MRILLTGGRGGIGAWAVHELIEAGHEVISLVRADSADLPSEVHPPTREVVGEASDAKLLSFLLAEAEAVVHLAAIPNPVGNSPVELFQANSLTTLILLQAAAEAGVKPIIYASSISALGMSYATSDMSPLYLPVDEEHPLRPCEGYALSKECDEATARMASRRWNMRLYGLRFPFVGTESEIREYAASAADDGQQARELWTYLDVRDAARAIRLALEKANARSEPFATVVNVIADDVLIGHPLADLVTTAFPDLAQQAVGLSCGFTTDRADSEFEFTAAHLIH